MSEQRFAFMPLDYRSICDFRADALGSAYSTETYEPVEKRLLVPWTVIFSVIIVVFLAGGLFIRNAVASSFDTSQQIRNARSRTGTAR